VGLSLKHSAKKPLLRHGLAGGTGGNSMESDGCLQVAREHIYARSAHGLYIKSGSGGYDTVFASDGLSESYVRNQLQRFCAYQKPTFGDDETDAAPPAYFMAAVPPPHGDGAATGTQIAKGMFALLFGKNSYRHGLRGSSVSVAYIVDEEEELDLAYRRDIEKLVAFDRYERDIDALGSRSAAPVPLKETIIDEAAPELFVSKELLFGRLNITREIFAAMIRHILAGIGKNRVLYIKLDCPRRLATYCARELMRYVYLALSVEARVRTSYLSYAPTLRGNNFFSVVFVDRALDLGGVSPANNVLDLTKSTENSHLDDCAARMAGYVDSCAYALLSMFDDRAKASSLAHALHSAPDGAEAPADDARERYKQACCKHDEYLGKILKPYLAQVQSETANMGGRNGEKRGAKADGIYQTLFGALLISGVPGNVLGPIYSRNVDALFKKRSVNLAAGKSKQEQFSAIVRILSRKFDQETADKYLRLYGLCEADAVAAIEAALAAAASPAVFLATYYFLLQNGSRLFSGSCGPRLAAKSAELFLERFGEAAAGVESDRWESLDYIVELMAKSAG
jgi:hypothetical protein